MTHKNRHPRLLSLILLAPIFLITFVTAHADPPTISIAEARSLPLGTVVSIDGVVTVPSGAFSSSTFEQGFAIQDSTGGIYVSTSANLGFELRSQVRLTGTLAESVLPGLLVIADVTEIFPHGLGGPKIDPLPVATGDVGEATEGQLVLITGTITQVINDLPFGNILVINDGTGDVNVFVAASTGINLSGLGQGITIEVTGFSGQFADHFEVDPRIQEDIVPHVGR